MAGVQYYIDLFTEKTWTEFLENGATVSGFSESRSAHVKKIKPGDLLIAYVTKEKKFAGVLVVLSEIYTDTEKIWTSQTYPVRLRVKLLTDYSLEDAPLIDRLWSTVEGDPASAKRKWSGWVRASPTRLPDDVGQRAFRFLFPFPMEEPTPETIDPAPPFVPATLDGRSVLSTLTARNFLSFGTDGLDLELMPLNVFIGANGSGKSNIVECLSLLSHVFNNSLDDYFENESSSHWAFKRTGPLQRASLEIGLPASTLGLIRYKVELLLNKKQCEIVGEEYFQGTVKKVRFHVFRDKVGIYLSSEVGKTTHERGHEVEFVDFKTSTRAEAQSMLHYDYFHDVLSPRFMKVMEGIRIYRMAAIDLSAIRDTLQLRKEHGDEDAVLNEDGENLIFVLSRLRRNRPTWKLILQKLFEFNSKLDDVSIEPQHDGHRLFASEDELSELLPASRVSDGTLRYLCLLAILMDETNVGVICIEEPELGLHPDILYRLGSLLRDATKHAQLLVTTHSDHLIDSLSEVPQAVIVCERQIDGTTGTRLKGTELSEWLNQYSLGKLWLRGEFGGTRW